MGPPGNAHRNPRAKTTHSRGPRSGAGTATTRKKHHISHSVAMFFFDLPVLAVAILDRLLHHSHTMVIQG